MPEVLFNIPLREWVFGTIEKMNKFGKSDLQSWRKYWLETYQELGGKSFESGSKGCPQHAASSNSGFWLQVRERYKNIIHEEPAISEQGQVKLARIMFENGLIFSNRE